MNRNYLLPLSVVVVLFILSIGILAVPQPISYSLYEVLDYFSDRMPGEYMSGEDSCYESLSYVDGFTFYCIVEELPFDHIRSLSYAGSMGVVTVLYITPHDMRVGDVELALGRYDKILTYSKVFVGTGWMAYTKKMPGRAGHMSRVSVLQISENPIN